MNYHNEFDPQAAAASRQLIAEGFIPNGHVDGRSIVDVTPDDLKGYTQCHFFAGICGWPYALQLVGWPEDRPVWTASCPCQPFSAAGKQKGKQDERHLWPVLLELIKQCRPPTIFGEQVAAAIAHGWLDEVADDLEREGYAFGAAVLPACGVGAPHKRDRLWFVAHTDNTGSQRYGGFINQYDTHRREDKNGHITKNSFWSDREWISCPDGKARLVEPSICLLADGVPERVGLLRAAGNAIVPQVAAAFIKASM